VLGGKILTVRGYRDGIEDRYRSFPGLIRFWLVAHPLQPGVVGPNQVRVLGSPTVCRRREPVVSRFFLP
jgi:hypothetical protein